MISSINSSVNIDTKCLNCNQKNKCPITKLNSDLCCDFFKNTLETNGFTKEELYDIETVCKLRDFNIGNNREVELIMERYEELLKISYKNKMLDSDKKVLMYAFVETAINEMFLQNDRYILPKSKRIAEIVPWFYEKNTRKSFTMLKNVVSKELAVTK